jgi:hypothetical protein
MTTPQGSRHQNEAKGVYGFTVHRKYSAPPFSQQSILMGKPSALQSPAASFMWIDPLDDTK